MRTVAFVRTVVGRIYTSQQMERKSAELTELMITKLIILPKQGQFG